jgi:hypothetical protein
MPVLAALFIHALAHDRWLLSVPVALCLLLAESRNASMRNTPIRHYLFVILGLAAGGSMLLASSPPPGPIAGTVLSPTCGGLVALSFYWVLCRHPMRAWTYAWLLVVLSANAPTRFALLAGLIVMMMVTLTAVAEHMGLLRAGFRAAVPLAAFAVLVTASTLMLAAAGQAAEGTLNRAVFALLRDAGFAPGLGLSKEIQLSAISSMEPSSRPLMELSSRPSKLRSQVMDTFDGKTWTASAPLRFSHPLDGVVSGRPARVLEITFLEDALENLPAPAGTWDVQPVLARLEGGGVLRASARAATTVTVIGDPEEKLPVEGHPEPHLLEVPEELLPLGAVARSVTLQATTPRQAAQALERFFSDGFRYSLSTNLVGNGHPLVVMVRERRPAYCIYFSAAMAIMLRTLEVPARVVGGFVPEEENPLTGRTMIRERDAHAWVEAWLADEQRYVPFDPTPWQGRLQSVGLQDGIGFFGGIPGAIQSALRRVWYALRNDPLAGLQRIVTSHAAWAAVAVLLALGLRRHRGRRVNWHQRTGMTSAHPELAALHRSYRRLVERSAGLRLTGADTDDEILVRLSHRHGDRVGAAARGFVEYYRQARYGGNFTNEATLHTALDALRQLLEQRGAEKAPD